MEDENSKQAEARKILDAIRKKDDSGVETPVSPQKLSWSVSEDADQLKALVEQSLGIKNQIEAKEDLPNPESIDPISVEQIKVMRSLVVDAKIHQSTISTLRQRINETLIRSYFEVVDFFKSSGRAKRCLLEGHQCLHCGAKLAATPVPLATAGAKESDTSQATTHPKL